jgi:hypothetical protein
MASGQGWLQIQFGGQLKVQNCQKFGVHLGLKLLNGDGSRKGFESKARAELKSLSKKALRVITMCWRCSGG